MKTKLFSSILAIGALSSGFLLNVTPATAGGGGFKGNCSNGGFPRQHQPKNQHPNQPRPGNSHQGDLHSNQPSYHHATPNTNVKPVQSAYKYDYHGKAGNYKGH